MTPTHIEKGIEAGKFSVEVKRSVGMRFSTDPLPPELASHMQARADQPTYEVAVFDLENPNAEEGRPNFTGEFDLEQVRSLLRKGAVWTGAPHENPIG